MRRNITNLRTMSHALLRNGLPYPSLQAQIFPTSSEDDDVGNVAGQQPQLCLWTLPPKPQRNVVHTFIGAPKSSFSTC
jgi:hypothetical protein